MNLRLFSKLQMLLWQKILLWQLLLLHLNSAMFNLQVLLLKIMLCSLGQRFPEWQVIVIEKAMYDLILASRNVFGCMNSDVQVFNNAH